MSKIVTRNCIYKVLYLQFLIRSVNSQLVTLDNKGSELMYGVHQIYL